MKIKEEIKKLFSGGRRTDKNTTVSDSAGGALDAAERSRRIKRAATITVERYGHIIERLAKE